MSLPGTRRARFNLELGLEWGFIFNWNCHLVALEPQRMSSILDGRLAPFNFDDVGLNLSSP